VKISEDAAEESPREKMPSWLMEPKREGRISPETGGKEDTK